MLTELAIENFKAFSGKHRVPIAPITVIFGSNSAGKSSLIQALLLLKQTLGGSGQVGPLVRQNGELVIRGDLVDLASFRSLIHRHETERQLGIGIATELGHPRVGAGLRRRHRATPSVASGPAFELLFQELQDENGVETDVVQTGARLSRQDLEIEVGLADEHGDDEIFDPRWMMGSRDVPLRPDDALQLLHWATETLTTSGDADVPATDPRSWAKIQDLLLLELRRGIPGGVRLVDHSATADSAQARSDSIRQSAAVIERAIRESERELARAERLAAGSPRTVELRDRLAALQEELQSSVTEYTALMQANPHLTAALLIEESWRNFIRTLRDVEHLGPMRMAPERFNVLSGERVRRVGSRGERLVDLLAADEPLVRRLNAWLARLEIPYKIDVRRVSDKNVAIAVGGVHCILLRDVRTDVEVSPADVGFGVGQVLPVVVGALTTKGTLCIEQPEVHLHPALQSKLADLFVECARREDLNHGAQFIIETHSEHLILRMQQLIRGGKLAPDSVSVLHVGFDDGGESVVKRLRLNEAGEFLDPWPGGFFDERFDLIFGD